VLLLRERPRDYKTSREAVTVRKSEPPRRKRRVRSRRSKRRPTFRENDRRAASLRRRAATLSNGPFHALTMLRRARLDSPNPRDAVQEAGDGDRRLGPAFGGQIDQRERAVGFCRLDTQQSAVHRRARAPPARRCRSGRASGCMKSGSNAPAAAPTFSAHGEVESRPSRCAAPRRASAAPSPRVVGQPRKRLRAQPTKDLGTVAVQIIRHAASLHPDTRVQSKTTVFFP
jgi:hypothetical protein